MQMLNLGCGSRFHPEWINIDWIPSAPAVLAHDLHRPLPFADRTFDVVYHSHVLEHFNRADAAHFLSECYRVCAVGGTIRVAVPDLERIVTLYLESLQGALANEQGAARRYEWVMLEMYDQVVRTNSGGETLQYLRHAPPEMQEFLRQRAGRSMLEGTMSRPVKHKTIGEKIQAGIKHPAKAWRYAKGEITTILMTMLWGRNGRQLADALLFRMQGENHQWMYDRYSLPNALAAVGFQSPTVCTAHQSRIAGWDAYGLDVEPDSTVYKPDSLFCEAIRAD